VSIITKRLKNEIKNLAQVGECGRSMNAIHEVPHPFLGNSSTRES